MVAATFSSRWYETFLAPISPVVTDSEVSFVARHMPCATYKNLLDIACGPGRHAEKFAALGYHVLGIDIHKPSIVDAQSRHIPSSSFLVEDMRNIWQLKQTFDGVVSLWHSFGFYDLSINRRIISDIASRLRPGGRAIFDIYNRHHFRSRQGWEVGTRNGVAVQTHRSWVGNRMRCEIRYETGERDILDWYLYDPEEFVDECKCAGLDLVIRCAWCDESIQIDAEHARMQFVLEKPGN